MKLAKFYNWYEEKFFYFCIGLSIIFFTFSTIFITVNRFAVDLTDDYKSMSQAFEENREYVSDLLNPNVKIDMSIGENNEYIVYSDETYCINVTLKDRKYLLIKNPIIQYPVSIKKGNCILSEKYYKLEDSPGILIAQNIVIIVAFAAISLIMSVIINVVFEQILKKFVERE